ncbi:MAG: alpha/beta hydrolase [Puia sp.]|nr:alpha/beta hydrolase [Puia sp.]
MLRYILPGSLACSLCLHAVSQEKQLTKYKDPVFPATTVWKDLSYAGPEISSGKKRPSTRFDLYEPKQDSTSLRPLIIWMHGGGFKFGSKEARGIRLWCKTFSARGYVCAAINYRMGRKDLSFNFTELVESCSRAVQDARQAIAFFKENYAKFRIDTGRIVLAGNSAGGMIALQAVYSSNADLAKLAGNTGAGPAILRPGTLRPGKPGPREPAQPAFADPYNPGNVAAVVNFWGGIFRTGWLANARVPIVSVHGEKDGIVPYDHKGFPLYGSLAIHLKADSLHIPNSLKTYADYSHELQKHFNPFFVSDATEKRWLEAGQFAADFLYTQLFAGRQ